MNQSVFYLPRFIPSTYELIAKFDAYGVEIWGTTSGKVAAIAYGGKRCKHDWHYSFSDTQALQRRIEDLVAGYEAAAKRKAELRAERNGPHNVQVGDVFVCSWGYDQTNIDYYQVTRVMGAMVEVREIARQSEQTEWLQGNCVPAPGKFIGKSMRKKISVWRDEPSFRVNSFSSAYHIKPVAVIEGKPIFQASSWTAYA